MIKRKKKKAVKTGRKKNAVALQCVVVIMKSASEEGSAGMAMPAYLGIDR